MFLFQINKFIDDGNGVLSVEKVIQFPTRVNTEIFYPKNKESCRESLNLDKDDILYYIKCVHNEKILPICLTENNILDISFKGLGSGETITEVLLTPDANGQLSTLAAGQKYTITPSAAKGTLGDLASNYNITYEPFTGTVTKKSLTWLF